MARYWYVGSFREIAPLQRHESGGGVYVLDVDEGTVADPFGIDTPETDVSWMVPSPDGRIVYTISRTSDEDGTVAACPVDPATGSFRAGETFDAGGGSPCHAALSAGGGVLLVANYSGGTIATFKIGTDGLVSGPVQVTHHEGSGPDPERQEAGHPHMIAIDPVTDRVLVPDLGADRIVAYDLDEDGAWLTAAVPDAHVAVAPGSGPRHLAFFADGAAVVAGELDSTVALLRRDGDRLAVAQSVTTLDKDPGERSYPSAIRVSGDLVYVSNRGPDTVATFRREGDSLTLIGTESCGGRWPRDLVVDEDERRLLVANQWGSSVAVLPLDGEGIPGAPTGIWSIPNPGSLLAVRS